MTSQEDQGMDATANGTSLESALMKVASELSEAAAALRQGVERLRDATRADSSPEEL
jgi:hypothetical protein